MGLSNTNTSTPITESRGIQDQQWNHSPGIVYQEKPWESNNSHGIPSGSQYGHANHFVMDSFASPQRNPAPDDTIYVVTPK
jgi:hypothetical protein